MFYSIYPLTPTLIYEGDEGGGEGKYRVKNNMRVVRVVKNIE